MTSAIPSNSNRLGLPLHGFALRLAATTSSLIVITCAILSWFIVQRNLIEVDRSSHERLKTIAEQVAQNGELPMLSGDRARLTELAHTVAAERDVLYLHFVDEEGNCLASTASSLPPPNRGWIAPLEPSLPVEVNPGVLELRVPIVTTQNRGQREELGFSSERVDGNKLRKQVGSLVIGISRANLWALRDRMLITSGAVTLIVVIVGIFLASLIARTLTRPLNSLAAATEAITHGQLNATVPVRHHDEIGALASSFNEMVQSLSRSRAELEEYSRNLEDKVRSRTESLERLNEELREANRLKSEFLATVSHELRTPLHVILGYTDMLADGGVGTITSDQLGLLTAIRRYSTLQLDLLTNVLDFARLTSGRVSYRIERFSLAPLLHDIEQLYQARLASGRVQLRIEQEPDLTLETDRIKLQEIIRNLVDNAVKFTDVGTIHVRAGRTGGDSIAIEVEDTGKGIPAAELDSIFEPFQQGGQSSTRNTGGVGLGLSIVKQLSETLGGSVTVSSVVGRGTKFRVEIRRRLMPKD